MEDFIKNTPDDFSFNCENMKKWIKSIGTYIILAFPFLINISPMKWEESVFVYMSLIVILLAIPRFIKNWSLTNSLSKLVVITMYSSIIFAYTAISIGCMLDTATQSLFHIFLLTMTVYTFLLIGIFM